MRRFFYVWSELNLRYWLIGPGEEGSKSNVRIYEITLQQDYQLDISEHYRCKETSGCLGKEGKSKYLEKLVSDSCKRSDCVVHHF